MRILLIIFAVFISLHSYAQQDLKEGIEIITERYGAKFVYDATLRTDKSYYDGALKGISLQKDLSQLFENSEIIWSIKGDYILLRAAQKYNIGGMIRDAASGETLIGTTIIEQGTQNGTYSNGQGFFGLKIKEGIRTITCYNVGYENKIIKIDIKSDTLIQINMTSSSMKVGDVVVTIDESEPKNMYIGGVNKNGGISMNFEQLKFMPSLLGEQDIFKYLQLNAGVSSGKEGMSGLNIRGGSSDQTQILLDDVPIYNQSHAFGLISIFSGEAIKSAELYKGYSSPMYGGRLSGVASMRMRDGNRYEHKQSLQLGTTTVSANLEGPIKNGKGSYLFSARYFIPELLLRGVYAIGDIDTRMLYGFYDITAKATYDLGSKNTIYLSLYSGNDNFGNEYYDTSYNYDNTDKEKLSKSKAGIKWGNSIASLRLNTTISPKIFMNNTLYYSFLGNEKYSDFENLKEDFVVSSNIKSQMEEIGFKSTFDHSVTSNYNLTYGANMAQQFFNPQIIASNRNGLENSVDYGKLNMFSMALFANNKFTFDKFTLNAGLRVAMYNNSKDIATAIEPRVSLSYDVNKDASVWISYVNNSQPLFSLNKYYFSVPVDYWIPFTGDKIQRSNQIAIGGRKSFGGVWDVVAEVYYKKSSNLSLIYDVDDFLINNSGFDVADGRAYGAELSVQYHKNRFGFMMSYAFTRSENNIGDMWRPYIYDTPHDINFLAMYDVLKRTNKKHTLSLNIGYKTGIPYMLSNETYPNTDNESYYNNGTVVVDYPKYANLRLTDYFRIDINYSMEKKLKKGSRIWQISLLNGTAHNNPYVVYRTKDKYRAMTLIPMLPSFSYKRNF